MIIQIDTREKPQKTAHIEQYFLSKQIHYHRSKNYVGDYISLASPFVVVERKQNVLEFAGNAGKNHDRFKRELERLDAIGAKMYIVIEEDIGSLEGLKTWSNKRSQMKGETLYKICKTWQERHNIEFVFCSHLDCPRIIVEILGGVYEQSSIDRQSNS